jgi:hypothetical protein
MKKPKLNTALLRKIQKHILEEPKRLDMYIIVEKEGKDAWYEPPGGKWPSCNTTGCIAGWGLVLSGKRITGRSSDLTRAAKLLGVSTNEPAWDSLDFESESNKLFLVENWPCKFADQYENAKTDKKRARVTANRIEHFIKHRD